MHPEGGKTAFTQNTCIPEDYNMAKTEMGDVFDSIPRGWQWSYTNAMRFRQYQRQLHNFTQAHEALRRAHKNASVAVLEEKVQSGPQITPYHRLASQEEYEDTDEEERADAKAHFREMPLSDSEETEDPDGEEDWADPEGPPTKDEPPTILDRKLSETHFICGIK